jgi:hypothetical protein
MEKRKKPCFVCGLFGHNAKQCTQVGLPCSEGLSLGDLGMSIHALAMLIQFFWLFEYNLSVFRFQFMQLLKFTSTCCMLKLQELFLRLVSWNILTSLHKNYSESICIVCPDVDLDNVFLLVIGIDQM